jgi:hypothetical protein
MPCFTVCTACNFARRAIDTALESGVPQTTLASLRNFKLLTHASQVPNQLAGVNIVNDSSAGYRYEEGITRFAGLVFSSPWLAVLSGVSAPDAEIGQSICGVTRHKEDIATVTAISAIGATLRHELFPQETQAAVTAVTGSDSNSSFVDEFHRYGLGRRCSWTLRSHYLLYDTQQILTIVIEKPRMGGALNSNYRTSGNRRPASDHVNVLSIFRSLFLEFHNAVPLRKQRVIPSHTDIKSRVNFCATLANNDISGNNLLTAVNLDAQSLGFRIATVLSAAACFFMSHCNIPFVFEGPIRSQPVPLNSVRAICSFSCLPSF